MGMILLLRMTPGLVSVGGTFHATLFTPVDQPRQKRRLPLGFLLRIVNEAVTRLKNRAPPARLTLGCSGFTVIAAPFASGMRAITYRSGGSEAYSAHATINPRS